MSKFKDDLGREWTLVLNYHLAARIEDELGIPLLSKLQEVDFHPRHCVEMVWMLIDSQAEKLGVTPEDFGRSVGGESLEHLCDALLDAIAFFYRGLNPQQANLLTGMKDLRNAVSIKVGDILEAAASAETCFELLDSLASTREGSPPGNWQKWLREGSQTNQESEEVARAASALREFLLKQTTLTH